MGELKNQFSWSTKRGGVFDECRRRYWFEYYGCWGGWDRRADDRTRSIYVLKQLKSRHAWAGSHVHDAVAAALQLIHAGLPAEAQELADERIALMRREFSESRERRYWDAPKKACGLAEHEFDEPVPNGEWQEISEKVRACVRAFFDSEVLRELRALPREHWLELEELNSFELRRVPVWVKLDLAYRSAGGKLRIVDWKTGRLDPNPDPIQLACYAIYASAKWAVDPAAIETVWVNLSASESVSRSVDRALIDSTRARIEESIAAMAGYLEGPVEQNAPRPEAAFPVTENTASCRRCPFRKVCPDSPLHRL